MDAAIFRTTQEPLRELYRKDAKAALLTLKARGAADGSTVTCKVETGRGLAVAGIHPKCGGSGLELCSGDLLLEALIACAGISLKAAATVLDIPVKSAVVSAEGDVDLRGTLGVAVEVPVGFKDIRLHFNVETDASQGYALGANRQSGHTPCLAAFITTTREFTSLVHTAYFLHEKAEADAILTAMKMRVRATWQIRSQMPEIRMTRAEIRA